MTTPTIATTLPSLPTPVSGVAAQPGIKDPGTGEDTGQGSRSGAEEFASMVAGLVAALLGTPNSSSEARPSPTPEGRGAQQEMEGAAGATVPLLGRAPALSGAVDGAETRPKTEVPGPVSALALDPAGPQLPDSGGVPGVSRASNGPPAPPESGTQAETPTPPLAAASTTTPSTASAAPVDGQSTDAPAKRDLGRVSAPSEADAGAGARPKLEAPAPAVHSGRASGASQPADTPGAQTAPAPTPIAMAAPQAPAPVGAASAPEATAPAPAATAAQLVEPVATVHRRGVDGSHTITVDITPDELGPVRIHIELRDGNVELRLAGHNEAARDALRAALPDLKRALEAAGVGTGSFQVSPDNNGGSQQQSQPQFGQSQHSANPQNGHARPAWAGPDGRAQHQPEPAPPAQPAGSLDLQL